MSSFNEYMRQLFGRISGSDVTLFFTVCIDETGTGGESPYVMLAGAFAQNDRWNYLERAWSKLLSRNNVTLFHAKEFNGRSGDFSGWGKLKRDRFIAAQKKIIDESDIYSVAVAVKSAAHADIKKKMKGIKGYSPRSDYSLCFSVLRIMVCQQIAKVSPNSKIRIIVEDGPYADGAARIYNDLRSTIGAPYRAAKHAEMLDGFAILPKGHLRGLEVADYFADRAISELGLGAFKTGIGSRSIRVKYTPKRLKSWYEGMIKEKERRRSTRRRKTP